MKTGIFKLELAGSNGKSLQSKNAMRTFKLKLGNEGCGWIFERAKDDVIGKTEKKPKSLPDLFTIRINKPDSKLNMFSIFEQRKRKYLSCSPNGNLVDLWIEDDRSGRQKWMFCKNEDGTYSIRIYTGVKPPYNQFLTVTKNLKKIILRKKGFKGSLQNWNVIEMKVNDQSTNKKKAKVVEKPKKKEESKKEEPKKAIEKKVQQPKSLPTKQASTPKIERKCTIEPSKIEQLKKDFTNFKEDLSFIEKFSIFFSQESFEEFEKHSMEIFNKYYNSTENMKKVIKRISEFYENNKIDANEENLSTIEKELLTIKAKFETKEIKFLKVLSSEITQKIFVILKNYEHEKEEEKEGKEKVKKEIPMNIDQNLLNANQPQTKKHREQLIEMEKNYFQLLEEVKKMKLEYNKEEETIEDIRSPYSKLIQRKKFFQDINVEFTIVK